MRPSAPATHGNVPIPSVLPELGLTQTQIGVKLFGWKSSIFAPLYLVMPAGDDGERVDEERTP